MAPDGRPVRGRPRPGRARPRGPVACLTYQSLCQVKDPAAALGNAAERRWAAGRARAMGVPVEEVEREAATWRDAAAQRRARELARIRASLKREITRGEHRGVELGDLLEPAARPGQGRHWPPPARPSPPPPGSP